MKCGSHTEEQVYHLRNFQLVSTWAKEKREEGEKIKNNVGVKTDLPCIRAENIFYERNNWKEKGFEAIAFSTMSPYYISLYTQNSTIHDVFLFIGKLINLKSKDW